MATVTTPWFYRWCDAMRQRVPQIPHEVCDVYSQSLDAGISLSIDEIAAALRCAVEEAAHWYAVARVWLLDPGLYARLFEAEDALADLRSQRTAFVADGKAMEDRLATLDEQIAMSKNYGLLSEQHAAEMAPKIAAMDEERLTLLRAMEREVPRQRQLLEAEERAVQHRLQAAQEAIAEAFAAQVDAVQAEWTTEALERLQPVLEVLTRATTIDEAYRLMGKALSLGGSAQLRGALMQRLHQR